MSKDTPIFIRNIPKKPVKFYARHEQYAVFVKAVEENGLGISETLSELMAWFVVQHQNGTLVIKEFGGEK